MILNNFYKIQTYMMWGSSSVMKTITSMAGSSVTSNNNLSCYNDWSNSYSYNPYIGAVNTTIGTSQNGGIILGSGNTPPTPNDYCLSGDLITTIYASVGVKKGINDEGNPYVEALITVTNTGTDTITIGECGLYLYNYNSGNGNLKYGILLERAALDTPITLEPSGVGQITYTLTLNYPTA